MGNLIIPTKKVIIASSLDGIAINGARECALVAFNVHHKLVDAGKLPSKSFFGRAIEPDELRQSGEVSASPAFQLFLRLRPLVQCAEDYLSVLKLIENSQPGLLISSQRMDSESAAIFRKAFAEAKFGSENERNLFKDMFYLERKRLQVDFNKWVSLHEPNNMQLRQLRKIERHARYSEGKATNGLVLYFVTSKDATAAEALCVTYGFTNEFLSGRIISREEGEGKVGQMQRVAAKEQVPPSNVWRLNDRLDTGEKANLLAAGFVHYFLVKGGYSFSVDYNEAKNLKIPVLEKNDFALSLAKYANEHGF